MSISWNGSELHWSLKDCFLIACESTIPQSPSNIWDNSIHCQPFERFHRTRTIAQMNQRRLSQQGRLIGALKQNQYFFGKKNADKTVSLVQLSVNLKNYEKFPKKNEVSGKSLSVLQNWRLWWHFCWDFAWFFSKIWWLCFLTVSVRIVPQVWKVWKCTKT